MMRHIYGSKLSSGWPALGPEVNWHDLPPSSIFYALKFQTRMVTTMLHVENFACPMLDPERCLGVVWKKSASGYRLKPCQVHF